MLEYDLFAWRDRGEPVFGHVQSRETHGEPATRWLHAYTYSDGFGGVLLEKASAAPGLAPQRDVYGNLVLDLDGAPVLAPAEPRWLGTGRVVLDNKGNPVRQYEPYFSSTEAYEAEAELREQGVTPVMHYDPLGRVVRTEWPDGTESRVEFTPWQEQRWDRSDTVLGSAWHAERMALAASDPERRAAVLTEAHANTPATAHLDALGRPFLQVEHLRDENEDNIFGETRLLLDVVGNVLQATDARGNVAEAREHGLLRQALRVTSEDAGEHRVLRSALGEPFRAWTSRGFVTTLEVDVARRPLRTVVTRPDASTFTAVRIVYGESVASPEVQNLRGRPFRVYDGAGLVQSDAFDFAGNLVSQTRRLTVGYAETPNWTALDGMTTIADLDTAAAALLEAEVFTTTAAFDALGRPVTQTTPDESVTHLAYDAGGKLISVAANVRGAVTPTDFVTGIEYDARGQRQRIDYGNGTRTTYEHDPRTFRLRRLHTTNVAGMVTHQDLRYTFDPVGNVTEIRDLAQPVVFTNNAAIRADQRFTYDALYRLIEAEGREHGSQGQPIADDFIPRAAPDDPTGLRAYVESYAYDLVGNILELQHQAPGGNWTRRYQYGASGNRLLATSAPGDGPGVFSHAYEYNAHGSMTAMPHLAEVAWDHADRMQSADLGGGGTVWFLYDSAGNRVRKIRVNQAGTSSYERIYVGSYEVYRERVNGDVELERQTLHVADDTGRICLVETKTIDDGDAIATAANISRYQYGNYLGSVGMELDEAGQLISYEEFHPYGTTAYRAVNSAVDVSPSRYRYTGKERDEETGLGHHGARYYASWLARWTAADPIGLGDGVNRFAYARGRPTGLVDPTGTSAEDDRRTLAQLEAQLDAQGYETQEFDVGAITPTSYIEPSTRGYGAGAGFRPGRGVYYQDETEGDLLARAHSGGADPRPERARGEVSPSAIALAQAPWPTAEGTATRAGRAFLDATPIGDALALRDAMASGDPEAQALAILGFIPGFGEGRAFLRLGDDVIDAGRSTRKAGGTVADEVPNSRRSTMPEGAGDTLNPPPANWKSIKEFGHTFNTHGAGAKNTRALTDRARSTGNPQGQWLDNQAAADLLSGIDAVGPASIRIPKGLGQVIKPDGSVVNAEWARIVPVPGGLRTAFPILP